VGEIWGTFSKAESCLVFRVLGLRGRGNQLGIRVGMELIFCMVLSLVVQDEL
jgi:hypothetical protein